MGEVTVLLPEECSSECAVEEITDAPVPTTTKSTKKDGSDLGDEDEKQA